MAKLLRFTFGKKMMPTIFFVEKNTELENTVLEIGV